VSEEITIMSTTTARTHRRKTVRTDDMQGLIEALTDLDEDLLVGWASDEALLSECRQRDLPVMEFTGVGQANVDPKEMTAILASLERFHRDHHTGSVRYCHEEPCAAITTATTNDGELWPFSATGDWAEAIKAARAHAAGFQPVTT
jgi:hypothetical protein